MLYYEKTLRIYWITKSRKTRKRVSLFPVGKKSGNLIKMLQIRREAGDLIGRGEKVASVFYVFLMSKQCVHWLTGYGGSQSGNKSK